ncbi:branched chain amino-acid ABC transporter substrate-binding protein [Bdellovibrio bacteriovorus W]|nr:branched chain amino-acid ABC transporter substrate-binding protein [Bdellovibrio bacteriovorus W]
MTLRFALLFGACFLLSCTTVATKKRPPYRPPSVSAVKKAKSVGGQAPTELQNESITSEVLALPAIPKADDALEYLKGLLQLANESADRKDQESYRQHALDIVENKLNEDQLEGVAKSGDFQFLRGYAVFRLGEIHFENKDYSGSRKYFNTIIEQLPGTDLAFRSQELLNHINAARNVQSKTVGVVLPLSGRTAPIAQRALRGLEMGLGLHLPGSGFRLAVMDSEGNPDSARRGVERLVKEDNVIAVVGSLLSKTAPAVAAKADELGVPSIALSQRSKVTEIGPTVFRNALTSEMQVRALVRTAMNDMGMKKFAILYPNDPYGVEFSNIFWDEVLARGGQITAVQTYSPKETDFRFVIQRLVGTYFGEARQDEFNVRLKELQKSDKRRSVRSNNLETVLPAITDFDAIFIPDSIKSLGQISAMLSYSDIRNVKLLGTNLWNTKDTVRRAGNFANNLIFVDSIDLAAGDRSRFAAEYKALYNEEPSLIEVQAYDSGLILRQLIAGGADSRESLTRALSQLKRFPGSIGYLSVNEDREVERPLIPLTIEKNQIVPLKVQKR